MVSVGEDEIICPNWGDGIVIDGDEVEKNGRNLQEMIIYL